MKTPVFGILCRGGKVWAQVVPDVEIQTLLPLIDKRVKHGSIICSDTWKSYTGIAAKGYVHRLVEHSKGEYADSQGNHITGLEGFWGYLKRRLASKGGIRKEKLPLYLAEYVFVAVWESTPSSDLEDLDTNTHNKGVQLVPLSLRVETVPWAMLRQRISGFQGRW